MSAGDDPMMLIDHMHATQADTAKPNASPRQGAHLGLRGLHTSRRKCSSGEKSRLELQLTCDVSWCGTNTTSAQQRDLKLSVMPYRHALHHVCAGEVCILITLTAHQMRLQW